MLLQEGKLTTLNCFPVWMELEKMPATWDCFHLKRVIACLGLFSLGKRNITVFISSNKVYWTCDFTECDWHFHSMNICLEAIPCIWIARSTGRKFHRFCKEIKILLFAHYFLDHLLLLFWCMEGCMHHSFQNFCWILLKSILTNSCHEWTGNLEFVSTTEKFGFHWVYPTTSATNFKNASLTFFRVSQSEVKSRCTSS